MNKKIALISIILCFFTLVSCSGKKDEVIVFDDSHPLALAPDVSWAVVKDPYAAYKAEPLWSAAVSGHCRKGEILQVIGKTVDKDNTPWYYFEAGWLPANSLLIYSNRYKAQTASGQLKD